MSELHVYDASQGVAEGFTSTAHDYDATVRHNVQGAWRLVMSLPPGDHRRILDVGCGTGWASLAMLERFPGITHVTGVDPAEGMLEVFRGKTAGLGGVEVDLRAAGVMDMGVAEGAYDAVVSSMAFHWFPDKQGAVHAMAAPLAPGGVLGILASGAGGEGEFRDVVRSLDPPAPREWDAAFDFAQRDVDHMESYLVQAGLEPLDIWIEKRLRHSTPEAYMERMRVVASHVTPADIPAEELEDLGRRLNEAMHAASGPRGFAYTFCKLYAVARKPS
ncbi:MAG: methyltransferase domain-containing protein [Thermoleophilia bacterium]